MKTKNWLLTVLAIFVVVAGFATEIPKMSVVKTEGKKALLTYQSTFNTPLEVSVYDENGDVLYYKKTKKVTDYKKVFNMSNLDEGNYTISVNYGKESYNRKLSIVDNEMTIQPLLRTYDPVFVYKNGKLDVSFFNTHLKNVQLYITRNGEIVSDVNLGGELAIHKRLNMQELKPGSYNVVLTDNFNAYNFRVQR